MKNLKSINTMYHLSVLIILLIMALQVTGQSKNDLKLFDACKIGDVKQAEKLISKGAKVNYLSPFNETPLLIACNNSNNDLIKLLLKNGADPYIKMDCFFIEFQNKRANGTYEVRVGKKQDGVNAVIETIENGNEEIFNLFLQQGINFNFEYQPDIKVGNYSLSLLYSAPEFLSGPPKAGDLYINGVQISWSETSFKGRVCLVNSKPTEPIKYTPLRVAALAKKKNYFIIEKLAELSSHELNSDFEKMTEFINDPKTIEILKKYKFIN